jgi:hypothetical protein
MPFLINIIITIRGLYTQSIVSKSKKKVNKVTNLLS